MKQTAVEWFAQELDKRHCVILNYPEYQKLLEQAKAMEKEQIMNAYSTGYNDKAIDNPDRETSKQYYNETFKSVKHNTDIRSMDKLIESNKKFDENNLKGFKYNPNDRSEDTPNITNFFY